jgi:aminoglycoside 2'-N-acetyltransferase I
MNEADVGCYRSPGASLAKNAEPVGKRGNMRWELRQVAELTSEEQEALRTLSLAVYPPASSVTWPGRAIEWAAHQSSVIGWLEGVALCYVGITLRDARWNDCAVRVGGIGGVKTHPASRGRRFATTAIQQALDFFREQGDVDFGLLVCEPDLVPFYEHLGWCKYPGELFVTQRQTMVSFTFNLPMTTPLRLQETLGGKIDLMGPPW